MKNAFNNILIVGLGVMGGSYLKKILEFDCNVFCIENDDNVILEVQKFNENIEFLNLQDQRIKEMDLVIITLFPSLIPEYFKELNSVLNKNCLVIEISGVKNNLVQKLEKYNFNFLLTHPMAGRENGGFVFSDPLIFKDANFIIINDYLQIDENLKAKFILFTSALGFNNIVEMSAQNHDAAITYTSQLSHILAVSLLMSKDYNDFTKDTIGDSFRNLTRIAKMNIPMWSTLFLENSDLLVNSIDNLIEELENIKTNISLHDEQKMHNFFKKAKNRRIEIEGGQDGSKS